VKEGIGGFASVSAAFGRVGRIQMGNPGLLLLAGGALIVMTKGLRQR
jgi:hypothetical protein